MFLDVLFGRISQWLPVDWCYVFYDATSIDDGQFVITVKTNEMDHTQPHWPLSAFFLTLGAMSHEGEGLKHSIESTCGIGQSDSTIVIFFIDPRVIGDTNLTIKIRIEIPLKSY